MSKKGPGKAARESSHRGKLIIIAAPSGGGKTSLVNGLLSDDDKLSLSVSHTTRKPRSRETGGKQYHFVKMEEFRGLVKQGAFLEHAMVFGNYYGTHAGALDRQLDQGLDVAAALRPEQGAADGAIGIDVA